MSKIEASGFRKSGSEGRSAPPEHPLFDADWNDRVSEARAKREKLLSERQGGTPPVSSQRDDPAPADGHVDKDKSGVLSRLTRADAAKALLVFSGAAGFGLGITLGVGMLIGLTTPPTSGSEPLAEAGQVQSPQIVTSPAPDPAMPYLAAKEVTDVLEEAPDLFELPKPFFAPAPAWSDAISLPEISAVQYMRADTDLAIAAALRSLPEAPELAADEMLYGSGASGLPQFYIHAPNGIPNDKLQGYVTDLENSGVTIAEIGRETFRVSSTHLRYYSPKTAEIAQAVARDLGVEARDFSENALNAERIEIWVAGRPKPADDAEPPRTGFFARLFNPQKVSTE